MKDGLGRELFGMARMGERWDFEIPEHPLGAVFIAGGYERGE